MTQRELIMEDELKRMLEIVQKEQAADCYSDETDELQSNLNYVIDLLDTDKTDDLYNLSGFAMGSAYYDGFIRGIRTGINLANKIIRLHP